MGYKLVPAHEDGGEVDPFAVMAGRCAAISGPVIFDVGAHKGHVAQEFRKCLPSAQVHAFEPFPECFSFLREVAAGDSAIHVHEFGLAEKSGERSFHANLANATNSLLGTDEKADETWGPGQVGTCEVVALPFSTLDSFMAESGLERVDILKMDVQGAEHLVIEGARETLAAGRIGMIYTEIITMPTYVGQQPLHEVLTQYAGHGFSLVNFYNPSLTDAGELRQIDALFAYTGAERS